MHEQYLRFHEYDVWEVDADAARVGALCPEEVMETSNTTSGYDEDTDGWVYDILAAKGAPA